MKLENKVALITGAARGIGYAIAKRYVEAGGRVAIADLDAKTAQAAAAELGGKDRAIGIEMNVTDEDEVNAGVDEGRQGIRRASTRWCRMPASRSSTRSRSFRSPNGRSCSPIHLDGAFLTTKAVHPAYVQAGRGSIIYMGSVHSKEASPLKSAYVTAKHGLLGLARVVAKEGAAHGVRANVICPGFVKTPLVEKQIPEQAADLGISEEEVVNKIMLGETVDKEFTTVEDVAELALLFAAFPTNALTGQSVVVSHGWYMN